MAKKGSVASIFMLLIGGLAIPGGLFANMFLKETVANNIDTALIEIENQGVPLVVEIVKDKGIPEALRGIRDRGVPIVEEMVLQIGGAEVLVQVEEAAQPVVAEMVTQMGVAEVLTQINDTAMPIVIDMVKQLGVAEVLNQISDTAIPIVVEMVKQIGVAEVLSQIRDKALPFVEEIVNASFLTQLLYSAYLEGEESNVAGIFEEGGNALLNMFFDYQIVDLGSFGGGESSFSAQISDALGITILGVSEWAETDLEYGSFSAGLLFPDDANPHEILAWGSGEIPGVMSDTEVGTGVLDFLGRYDEANGDSALQNAMVADYPAPSGAPAMTWSKLETFVNYFRNYFVPIVIPMMVAELQDPNSQLSERMSEYVGMDTDDIAYMKFLQQWADCSEFEGGMDFHEVSEDFPVGTYGFEVNRPDPSGITIDSCYDLWDETNDLSLLSMDGMETWYEANSSASAQTTLFNEFTDLTQDQMDILMEWLWYGEDCFSNYLVPLLLESEEGYGMPIEDFAELLFMEQWANGTIMGEEMYVGGLDFGDMVEGIPLGTTGFEVGVPTPTGITGDVATNLWDPENPYSLFSMDGMEYWVEANESSITESMLMGEFGLNQTQMDQILSWLWDGEDCFSQKLVPILIESDQGYSMPLEDFAQLLFMEIWANGTAFGEVMYEGGMDFGEMVEGIPLGTKGFEVGVPTPTGMSGETVAALWDSSNEYSLFSMDGMAYWAEAYENSTVADMLITEFGLTQTQMNLILSWLWEGEDCFSQGLVPVLIESDFGYGMTVDELASLLFMEQWANGTILGDVMYDGGLDFGDMVEGLPKNTKGFEVGVPIPTGMSGDTVAALWNESDPHALFNMDGMTLWFEANSSTETADELQAHFGLTETQTDMILDWLWLGNCCFSQYLVPILIESDYGYGMPFSEFAFSLLMEQWTNGTILGDVMYEGGLDFSEMMDAIDESLVGFEVGVPEATGIAYPSAKKLYDDDNSKSLTNDGGIDLWVKANDGDEGTRDDLMGEFDLSEDQIDSILDWLFERSFREDIVPVLIELPPEEGGRGMSLEEMARSILLEQWCNGTADGREEYPYGFGLPLSSGEEVFGFELGFVDTDTKIESSGMSKESVNALWDKESDTSLTTKEGLEKWWVAVDDPDSDTAKELQDANKLSDKQMEMVLTWLPRFSEDVMPLLAQDQYNLPLDTNTLGNYIMIGGFMLGSVLVGTGTVMRKKSRKNTRLDKLVKGLSAEGKGDSKFVKAQKSTSKKVSVKSDAIDLDEDIEVEESSKGNISAETEISTANPSIAPNPMEIKEDSSKVDPFSDEEMSDQYRVLWSKKKDSTEHK